MNSLAEKADHKKRANLINDALREIYLREEHNKQLNARINVERLSTVHIRYVHKQNEEQTSQPRSELSRIAEEGNRYRSTLETTEA